jgi:uncharacterized integral membrane protein
MGYLIVFSILVAAVAVFALGNTQPVAVRFLYWEVQSSLALVVLCSAAGGILIAGVFVLAGRVRRWSRPVPPTSKGPAPPDSKPPVSPPTKLPEA